MANKKKDVDWDGVGVDFRAGIKSLREIGAAYHISHVAVTQEADKRGWKRDLSTRIKLATEEKLNNAILNSNLNKTSFVNHESTSEAIVDANSDIQRDVILAHRADIRKFQMLCSSLLAEITVTSENRVLLEDLGVALAEENGAVRTRLFNAALSIASRVDVTRKLAEAFKIFVALEREAYGLEKSFSGDTTINNNLQIAFVQVQRDIPRLL